MSANLLMDASLPSGKVTDPEMIKISYCKKKSMSLRACFIPIIIPARLQGITMGKNP